MFTPGDSAQIPLALGMSNRLTDISPEGALRLLTMVFSMLLSSFLVMPPIAATFLWYESLVDTQSRLSLWALAYTLLTLVVALLYWRFKREQSTIAAKPLFDSWITRVNLLSAVHGLGLSYPMLLIADSDSIEFKYLYLLTIAVFMAGHAMHQSPMISVYRNFLLFGWIPTLFFIPLLIPKNWQFVFALAIIYFGILYFHALHNHRFFVRFTWIEEEQSRLAERYKLAKEQAESTLREKNQFLTTASHDLRQPVHAMGFLIESMISRNQEPSMQPTLLDLKQSVRAITQMFNSLLDLSKIEMGALSVKLEPIDLQPLLNEIIKLFSDEANSRNLTLRLHLPRQRTILMADSMLLRQSLINLIQNAMRYTLNGGVLIGIRRRAAGWRIEIWDTGIGVTLKQQEDIYSPFYRQEHAWHLDNEGHGLGLAVVARCAKLMDADYGFDSLPAKGSRFWLQLPAVTDLTDTRLCSAPFAEFVAQPLQGCCLIIDDDPAVCAAWQSILSAWQLTVHCFVSGQDTLSKLDADFVPDVILCDQRLRSGESGFEVLQILLDRYPNARGAMVSGEFNSPELIRAEEEGYVVLHKPLEPEVLYALLRQWLSLKPHTH